MAKPSYLKGIDFSAIDPNLVRKLITDIYQAPYQEKRDALFSDIRDRRQAERRMANRPVLLDTRAKQGRRRSLGRRKGDTTRQGVHTVGIDCYA